MVVNSKPRGFAAMRPEAAAEAAVPAADPKKIPLRKASHEKRPTQGLFSFSINGDPKGSRTPVAGMRTRCPSSESRHRPS
jgi:hypothetical protein